MFRVPAWIRKEATGRALTHTHTHKHMPTSSIPPLPKKTSWSLAGCNETNAHWRQNNPLFWLVNCTFFFGYMYPAGTSKTSAVQFLPVRQLSLVISKYKTLHSRWPLRYVGWLHRFHWHNILTDSRWTTEQWRWSGGAFLPLSLSAYWSHGRPQCYAREANYRNTAPGQERAPKLKCRALFPEPYPTRSCSLRLQIDYTSSTFHGPREGDTPV